MKHLKLWTYGLGIVVFIGFAILFSTSPAQAQAVGNVNVQVVVPGVLQLRYYSELVINISEAHLATLAFGTDAVDAGSASLASWSDDAGITLTALSGTNTGTQVIENAWEVKAIGNPNAGSNIRVAVALNAAASTLTNNAVGAFGTLNITSVQTQLNGGGAFGASVDFASAGPGNPDYGDIEIGLDFANASHAGTYVNAVPQFTITASHI